MSNVRPHGNVLERCLVNSALNQHHSCNCHRLSAAHSGRNLHGLSFLQPVFPLASQPTLNSDPNSHLQPPSGWLLQPPPAALALRGYKAGTFFTLPFQKRGFVGAYRSALRIGFAPVFQSMCRFAFTVLSQPPRLTQQSTRTLRVRAGLRPVVTQHSSFRLLSVGRSAGYFKRWAS